MQSEESVEVDRAGLARGERRPRDRDVRPQSIVRRLTVRDDDVERIRRAALEETDQRLAARAAAHRRAAQQLRAERGATQKARAQSHRHEGHRAGLHEDSAIHGFLSIDDPTRSVSAAGTRARRSPARRSARAPRAAPGWPNAAPALAGAPSAASELVVVAHRPSRPAFTACAVHAAGELRRERILSVQAGCCRVSGETGRRASRRSPRRPAARATRRAAAPPPATAPGSRQAGVRRRARARS